MSLVTICWNDGWLHAKARRRIAALNRWTPSLMLTILWLLLIFIAGLVVLYFGAEGTLHGAVGIATRMGVSQLVIGLTLVAFGTSAPSCLWTYPRRFKAMPTLLSVTWWAATSPTSG